MFKRKLAGNPQPKTQVLIPMTIFNNRTVEKLILTVTHQALLDIKSFLKCKKFV